MHGTCPNPPLISFSSFLVIDYVRTPRNYGIFRFKLTRVDFRAVGRLEGGRFKCQFLKVFFALISALTHNIGNV